MATVHQVRPQSRARLFGSRVDDHARGGDIDVLVLDDSALSAKEKLKIKRHFYDVCGEQKFDLISFAKDDDPPFRRLIEKESIDLDEY
ncbi:MAG: nucleotidyltransferase domain-containing protein [Bacteroidota bacterium]